MHSDFLNLSAENGLAVSDRNRNLIQKLMQNQALRNFPFKEQVVILPEISENQHNSLMHSSHAVSSAQLNYLDHRLTDISHQCSYHKKIHIVPTNYMRNERYLKHCIDMESFLKLTDLQNIFSETLELETQKSFPEENQISRIYSDLLKA